MGAILTAIRGGEPVQDLSRGPRRWAGVLLFAALAPAWVGCATFDEKERQLALRPTPTQPGQAEAAAAAFKPGDQRWLQPAADGGQVALWWLPQADPAAPALLYLHGTFRNLYGNLSKIGALRQAGYAVLAVDYRGWGDSSPRIPSEDSIQADAQVAWAEFQRRAPEPSRRVIFGHSMGGAVAVSLASSLQGGTDYAALVLEATFTRMPDVAAEAGFWGRIAASITSLDFNSASRIPRINAPITILHGTADKTVPFVLGQRLLTRAPPGTRFVEFQGGTHSRLHEEQPQLYQDTLKSVLPPPADTRKTRPATPDRSTSP